MGIDNREDLIQTIYRMTDDGHAADLAPFISAGLRYLLANGANLPRSLASRARFMRDLLPKPHYAADAAALKHRTMCVWGFMPDGGVESMADGRGKPVAAIAYLCAGALFYDGWTQYFAAYSLGRLYWQAEGDAMQAYFAHLKYDASGARMFNELISTTESYYAQLPWRPLNEQPTCPETLKGVSDL